MVGCHEDLFRLYKVADPKGHRNLKKTSRRRDNVLLDSGHYSTRAWGALNKCWKGFKMVRQKNIYQESTSYMEIKSIT
jgi:hypothetical protein